MHKTLKRRTLLGSISAIGAASVVSCSTDEVATPLPERVVFRHGVASGDPLPDAVILWTRVTIADDAPVDVDWQIATEPTFADVVREGTASTDADRDHTVKIDVDGLAAATTYFYRFVTPEETSPIGRTRTAGAVDRLRLGVCSCSGYERGYFNAYAKMAQRADLDVVVHLGDYIYEYAHDASDVRQLDPPHEITTLEDYRRRYAHYRGDPDLQAVHRQHPMVHVWDDHETANNSWNGGAGNHDAGEGDWEERKAQAYQAYREWMPTREQPDGRLWRKLSYGGLLDLIMLDTRIWGRDVQAADEDDPLLDDPERSLLGEEQEAWLADQLSTSTATWRLLGQQVMVGQLTLAFNTDQWDGYPFAQARLFELIRASDNVVVLTGDIHMAWGLDLTDDPFSADYDPSTGAGAIGVEIVVPGITSSGVPDALAGIEEGIKGDSPHVKYVDVTRRGYAVVDITAERVQSDWFHLDTVAEIGGTEVFGGALFVQAGERHWRETTTPTEPPPAPAPAPPDDYAEPSRDAVA